MNHVMKRILTVVLACLLLAACGSTEEQLRQRAAELCQHIPDHELLEQSRDYLTEDFYAILDTMFHHLPEHEAMDHEWLYYFVTGNGGTIANYEVTGVQRSDKTHAVATILVRQQREDGSFDEQTDVEEHRLYMEWVSGEWLISDFDEHKQDCINYIANNRREQALRNAISDYLVREIGSQYEQGDVCIPVLMMVDETELDANLVQALGDFWLFWYKVEGDTLKTVSGGNHSGCITLDCQGDVPVVTSFEQTEDGAGFDASARRIFGPSYEIFQNMHSNHNLSEAARREQLQEYLLRHDLAARYYQDYGWDAVEITD